MKQKPFPKIKGVRFKLIPGYEGYAISDDERVWIGKGGRWRKMEPYQFCDGEMVVCLSFPSGGSGSRKIKDLMKVFEPDFDPIKFQKMRWR